QRRFIDNYVETGQGAKSARMAGYGKGAAVRACNLLKRPDVQEEIQDRQFAMRIEAGVSKADLAQAAMDAHDQARTVTQKLQAIDLMAKLYGLYPKN
ncbi:MAG: hypothetical protein E2O56_05465, partial [Gammaproteobacteria bacterium]